MIWSHNLVSVNYIITHISIGKLHKERNCESLWWRKMAVKGINLTGFNFFIKIYFKREQRKTSRLHSKLSDCAAIIDLNASSSCTHRYATVKVTEILVSRESLLSDWAQLRRNFSTLNLPFIILCKSKVIMILRRHPGIGKDTDIGLIWRNEFDLVRKHEAAIATTLESLTSAPVSLHLMVNQLYTSTLSE